MRTHNVMTRFRRAFALVTLLAAIALGSHALTAQQYTHNTTTLAAAQTSTDTTISLTAVSAASGSSFGAVQAGQIVFVDQEAEVLTSVTSTSTIWNVQRRGRPTGHASGTPVYIGPGSAFQNADPAAGACTTANQPKFWINIQNGGMFTCGANSVWAKGNTPWMGAMNSGNGATVTLTAAQSGQTFLFDRAAGIIYTLPPPFPGMTFDFIASVSVTSNAYTVVTNSGSVFVTGTIQIFGSTPNTFVCNGTSHIKVTSDGATKGGLLGSWQRWTAVSSTLWNVSGLLAGSGTAATACST